MPLTPIHTIWIGPPKFENGGSDVLLIFTADQNYKKFNIINRKQQHPIKFYCLPEYVENYREYLRRKDIALSVEVISITDYLASLQNKSYANLISEVVEILRFRLHPERNHIVDVIIFKDLLSLVVNIEGGYYLDTTIRVTENKPFQLPIYDTFKFPVVIQPNQPNEPEVWMHYLPDNPNPVTQRLQYYLEQHRSQGVQAALLRHDHSSSGNLITDAVEQINNENALMQQEILQRNGLIFQREGFGAVNLNLSMQKQYQNSHRPAQQFRYSPAHTHVIFDDITQLRFCLEHGADVNANANTQYQYTGFPYNTTNERMIHTAFRYLLDSPETDFKYDCAELLLTYGADINTIYYFEDCSQQNPSRYYTPLTHALYNQCRRGLALLLNQPNLDLNLEVNGQSVFWLALMLNFGTMELLTYHQGADANLTMHNYWLNQNIFAIQETPVFFAIRNNDKLLLDELLQRHASINTIAIYRIPDGTVQQFSPLQYSRFMQRSEEFSSSLVERPLAAAEKTVRFNCS